MASELEYCEVDGSKVVGWFVVAVAELIVDPTVLASIVEEGPLLEGGLEDAAFVNVVELDAVDTAITLTEAVCDTGNGSGM